MYIYYPAARTAALSSLPYNTHKSFILAVYTVANSYIMAFSPRLAVSARLASRAFTSVRPVVPLTAARCFHSTPISMGEHPVATLNVCFATNSENQSSHAHVDIGGAYPSPSPVIPNTL